MISFWSSDWHYNLFVGIQLACIAVLAVLFVLWIRDRLKREDR